MVPVANNTAGINRLTIKCVSLLVAICFLSCNNCTTAEVIIVNFVKEKILKYLNTLKFLLLLDKTKHPSSKDRLRLAPNSSITR